MAAAVSILLMVIVTEAFQRGLDMFRHLKAAGDMNERLRTAARALRDDLAAPHFVSDGGSDRQYLSNLDLRGNASQNEPPDEGFFRIIQQPEPGVPHPTNPQNLPCIFEGSDVDGFVYTRATQHALQFTVLRLESSPSIKHRFDPSYAFIGDGSGVGSVRGHPEFPQDLRQPGMFSSRWAEVAYFLRPNGRSTGSVILYNLYRREKLVLPRAAPGEAPNVPAVGPVNPAISSRMVVGVGPFYNRSNEICQPRARFGMLPASDNPNDPNLAGLIEGGRFRRLDEDLPLGLLDPRSGDDVLLTDVISFEVKVAWDRGTDVDQFGNPIDPEPQRLYQVPGLGVLPGDLRPNPDYPFDYLPLSRRNRVLPLSGYRVFDTWCRDPNTPYGAPFAGEAAWSRIHDLTVPTDLTSTAIPLRIRVKALLIRLRIWDAKRELTRQLTLVIDV